MAFNFRAAFRIEENNFLVASSICYLSIEIIDLGLVEDQEVLYCQCKVLNNHPMLESFSRSDEEV